MSALRALARHLPLWRLGRIVRRLLLPRYRYLDERENQRILAVLRRFLRPDSSTVDVGSHRGLVLRECLRLAPGGRHYAVEPLPELAARLRQRFPQVEVLELALWDEPGEMTFHRVASNPGLSGLRLTPLVRPPETVDLIRARTARLDDVLPPEAVIDFLKVDVEGAELQVLRGALRTIRRSRPWVVFEHEPNAAAPYGTTPSMLHAFLVCDCGLAIFTLDGAGPLSAADFTGRCERGKGWNFLARP